MFLYRKSFCRLHVLPISILSAALVVMSEKTVSVGLFSIYFPSENQVTRSQIKCTNKGDTSNFSMLLLHLSQLSHMQQYLHSPKVTRLV